MCFDPNTAVIFVDMITSIDLTACRQGGDHRHLVVLCCEPRAERLLSSGAAPVIERRSQTQGSSVQSPKPGTAPRDSYPKKEHEMASST